VNFIQWVALHYQIIKGIEMAKKQQVKGVPKPRPKTAKFRNTKLQPYRHGLHLDFESREIDTRTKLGKAHKALKQHLREFVGEGTVVSELLISRIVFKSLKLFLFESSDIENPIADLPPAYLSMSNSLRRDLVALSQIAGRKTTTPDLMTYLEEHYGKQAGS
jgi:hypothetical protein